MTHGMAVKAPDGGSGRFAVHIRSILNYRRKSMLPGGPHPFDAGFQLSPHGLAAGPEAPPVPGKDPFEGVTPQLLHGFDLPSPGMPAGVLESVKMSAPLRPGEMVAREEEFFIE